MLKMIDLPYPLNALEPYYSKQTLDLHYNILYKGYIDNTNKTEEKLEQARKNNDFSSIKCLEKDLSLQQWRLLDGVCLYGFQNGVS